ncbi:2OG-Fe(II) oxygenase [Alcanivorax quisquiliarum]|uniref:2OG-Fe(II) oxygenase n=1 Tax=Alcanivorax quisquiliarum TaxID=2933565 RepID=A0ABT0E4A3_9GAMM|nr:2OG-Fe(II) oxygenase [Alcanivorax quisquiliarum]MCK0536650.1 2OG-Fe(II) oxygenase [Alcanivorax quisquiliarum]
MDTMQPPVGGGAGNGARSRIVDGLITRGYALEQAYFSPVLVRALRSEALQRDLDGEFSVRESCHDLFPPAHPALHRNRCYRLNGGTLAQLRLLQELQQLRCLISQRLLPELATMEADFVVQAAGVAQRRHLVTEDYGAACLVSVVIYLNALWTQGDGGGLRLWPAIDSVHPELEVTPRAGTLVCFLGDQIAQEVIAPRRDRMGIAGRLLRAVGR